MVRDNDLIKVLIVKPMKEPYIEYIKNDLKTFQEIVGGDIEIVPNSNDNTLLICNEYGKIDGLPVNRALKVGDRVVDIIAGNFLVVGDAGEDFCSLTDKQCEEHSENYELKNCLKDIGVYFKEDEQRFNDQTSVSEESEQGMDML